PEPVTNWTASVTEDIAVVGGLWTALNYPVLFIAALILFILLAIWLLPKIWRAIKRIAAKIRGWFKNKEAPEPESAPGNEEIARRLESKSADEP
ncbi:hypothetical protein BOV91_11430, partial [Solemya velum gill symbiont]